MTFQDLSNNYSIKWSTSVNDITLSDWEDIFGKSIIKSQRFFIVNNRIMNPAGADPMRKAFHGKFHVFRETVAPPPEFPYNIRRNTHPGSPKTGG